MRTIKINLEDRFFDLIEQAKKESGLSWEKFIINSITIAHDNKISEPKEKD